MRCPECEKTETPHEFRMKSEMARAGKVDVFWDEKNRQHAHDETIFEASYWCNHRHHYTRRTMPRCAVDGCAWNLRPEVNVKPLGEF